MNIGLVIVAYNSGPDLQRLAESARVLPLDHLHMELFFHSNDTPTLAACEEIVARRDCTFHDLRRNAGLARAWNTGVLNCYEAGADVVVVANDDVVFGDGDLHRLAAHAVEHPDAFLVACGGHHKRFDETVGSHGYSCYALNPVALEVVGCFDENLFPAYFEDCDHWRRARLAGLDQSLCPGASVAHIGSGTIHRDPHLNQRNGQTFEANKQYYRRKWGGENDQEVFETPFDDSRFTLRIAPEDRHHPYGTPYDRVNPEALAPERDSVEVAV